MLGSWVIEVIEQNGMDYPFQHIRPMLEEADVIFANLEAPFTTGGHPFPKKYNFRVPPKMAEVLKAGGINLVSLANNHILDYGVEGLTETLETLKQWGIYFVGAGLDLQEARKPAILSIGDQKIGFLAYSLTFPEEFWATDSTAGTCFPFHHFVFQDVQDLKKEVDWVIISCHWGQELMDRPKPYQITLAHQLIDAGADVILGHHPHVIQGIEIYRGKPIVYSLGNFIFGSYSENAKVSMLVEIRFQTDATYELRIHPINVYNKEVEFQPKPLEGLSRQQFLTYLENLSRELNLSEVVISSDGKLTYKKNKP